MNNSLMIHLFIGQDIISDTGASQKEITLQKIKQSCFSRDTQDFNFDILYARELHLKTLQERLIALPGAGQARLLLIKDAQSLRPDVKEYLLRYFKKPYPQISLVLDAGLALSRDEFINTVSKYAQVYHFKSVEHPSAFLLFDQIKLGPPGAALKVLNQLLKDGQKPELILGGLRYSCERDNTSSAETKRRLKLLLACDLDIKTSKIKPEFALERLVMNLCGLFKA